MYNGRLYIVTNEDAPRYRMFMAEAGNYERDDWTEIIPQTEAVLQGAAVWGGKLFAQYEQNATSQLRIFDLEGKIQKELALPALGTVFGSEGKWNHDEIFYGFVSFTVPPTVYRYDLKTGSASVWAKVDAPSIDPAAYEVKQEWFHSKDGTRVPMFVVNKKGLKKDGHNPTLLTGYGGFNVSMSPSFSRTAYLWMEHGGIYAMANLRGGAEFGEDWHRAGMLDKKQNVFDDMIAGSRTSDCGKIYGQGSSGDSGRIEWRTADGSDDHAEAGFISGGGVPGATARHAALSEFSDCQVVDSGVREFGQSGAV